jgi:hypothetical protein
MNKSEINPKNMKMIMKYDARQDAVIIASFINRYILLGSRRDDNTYRYSIKWKKDEDSKSFKWLVEFNNIQELNSEFGLKLDKKTIQKQIDKLEDKYFG